MINDAKAFWISDRFLHRAFNVNWQLEGDFYSLEADFDLACMYCMMSV